MTKLDKYKIAKSMMDKRFICEDYNIYKMIHRSTNKIHFDDIVKRKICLSEHSNFHDFSYLMGCMFKTYNLYGYQYVDKSIKEFIGNSNINKYQIEDIINTNQKEIISYFKDKYDINKKDLKEIFDALVLVDKYDSLYGNEIVFDIGKMLVGYFMYTKTHNLDNQKYNFLNGYYIDYYNEINAGKIKKLKK